MLANSTIYGRFIYFITVEPMPQAISLAIQQDVQALLCNKDASFLATEEGTELPAHFSLDAPLKGRGQHPGLV